jgi:hypothetical protein
MEYRIERLIPAEFDQLIPLMQNCFGMNVDLNYFHWKYLQNPIGEFIGFVAKDEYNAIIAFEGLIPIKYIINGNEKILYHSVDTMTHSSHRRKGLYQKLAFKGYEYLKNKNELFVYGFGGKMSSPALLKFGWKTLFTIPFFFRTKIQIKLSGLRLKNTKSNYFIREIVDRKEILTVIKSKEKIEDITLKTTVEFVNWKLTNPRFEYKIIGVYCEAGMLQGYAIYYFENNKIMLFDARFIDNARPAEKIIFRYLDDLILERDYKGIVTFSQENTIYSKLLHSNGFIKNPFGVGPMKEKLPFMIYTDEKTFSNSSDPKYWSVRPFDHDAF